MLADSALHLEPVLHFCTTLPAAGDDKQSKGLSYAQMMLKEREKKPWSRNGLRM